MQGRLIAIRMLLMAAAIVAGQGRGAEPVSPVKADEVVIFFPTAARLADDGANWLVPIHGWIFEPERGDFLRERVVRGLLSGLEIARDDPRGQLFEQRVRWFLVDSERGKELVIRLDSRRFTLPRSAPNGHFTATLTLPREEADRSAESGRLRFQVVLPAGDDRAFGGSVMLLPPRGVSVISDIDDTLKVTEVGNRRRVIENTFLEPFQPVAEMPKLFQSLSDRGATFHYVSNAPWQLYSPLAGFLQEAGFPDGTIQLREFRIQDGEFLKFLLQDPLQAKLPRVERWLADYPGRRFILIGDSGERDPQVYAEVARRHPEQVLHIFIRDVTGEASTAPRYAETFRDLPAERWTIFTDPGSLVATLENAFQSPVSAKSAED